LVIGGLSIGFGYCFWAIQDPMQRMGEMGNFTKNVAMLGSTLMFLAM
jgi:hypothetical protein